MLRLSDGDFLAVLGVVREAAGVASRDEFGPLVLREMAGLVRSDVTSLNEVDPASRRLVYLVEPASYVFPAGAAGVFAELAHRHPLVRHHADTGDGSAIKIGDFLDAAAWRESEIYRRFYAQLGLEHQMSITLPAPRPIVLGIALNRAQGDFDERDRAVLNLVRPHLAQSWRRTRDHERLEILLGAASGVLSESGAGVIVLGDPVQELTGGALVTLFRFFGRPTPRDALPVRVRSWLDSQQAQVGPAADSLDLGRPLRATVEGRQLVLRYLPGVHGREDVILLNERAVGSPSGTLRALGLTDREVSVVQLLGSGASNADIAERLFVSPWTVKRHLSNLYDKLGVRNRAGAAAIAVEIEAHHMAGEQ